MAEPLGLIGVVGVAVQLVQLSTEFGLDWKEAPAEASSLIRELQSLKTVLSETHINLISNPDFVNAFRGRHSALLSEFDPLYGTDTMAMVSTCKSELESLLEDLKKRTRGSRLGWERLKGAFQAPKTREAVENLYRKCLALNQLLQIDMAAMTASIHREVKDGRKEQQQQHQSQYRALNHIRVRVDDEAALREQEMVLDWLTPIDYFPQQNDFFRRRQPGTGQWLLDSEEFRNWVTTKSQTLFCPGIPGAGKTTLTSIVIDHLNTRFYDHPDVGIAYVYCNFRRHDEQDAEDLLASLLKQLAQQRPSLPDGLNGLYSKHAPMKSRPSVEELSECLASVSAEYSQVFIIVDALDECDASYRCRTSLLDELLSLQSASSVGANLFATSRPISDIVQRFQGEPSLEIRASREDIERYLRGHIGELSSFVTRRQELQEEIITGISDATDGMFLLAQLFFEFLKDKTSPTKVRKALTRLREQRAGPGEDQKIKVLSLAYDQAMERINGQLDDHRHLARLVLSWITCAMRPLATWELQHALAVELGDQDFDEDNMPEVEDIVLVCAGLVTVEDESGIIRLVHYTTQEYFEKTRDRWFPNAESDISKTCATYLSFWSFGTGPSCRYDEFRERVRLYPFYKYMADNWGHHTRKASSVSDEVLGFLLSREHTTAAGEFMQATYYPCDDRGEYDNEPLMMQGIHLAAYFGLDTAIQMLLDRRQVNPNGCVSCHRTPLMFAAEEGHLAAVQVLLAADGIDVDAVDTFKKTALYLAASNGHDAVMRALIDSGKVDVNAMSWSGTPLHVAVEGGHESAVQLLLATSEVDVNVKTEGGDTPLAVAAEKGHQSLVECLLAADGVELDTKNGMGQTPLHYAAKHGHTAIVQILLAAGPFEPDSGDNGIYTPFYWAVSWGDEAMPGSGCRGSWRCGLVRQLRPYTVSLRDTGMRWCDVAGTTGHATVRWIQRMTMAIQQLDPSLNIS